VTCAVFTDDQLLPMMMMIMMLLTMVVIVRGRLQPVTSSSVLGEDDIGKTQQTAVAADEVSASASACLYFTLQL